jgi:geranylgeranyl diphosphate synthase type II
MAFQLQDDLLDVFGDEQRFGKKTGGDILENKKTFLYLKAFESATKKELETLHHAFFTPGIEPQQKISLVKKVYETLKIKEITMNEIGSYHEKALTFLNNIQVSESRKVELTSLTKQLLTRDF